MSEWTIYDLTLRGALHVGQRGVGQEETACHVPADTLFAALLATWVDAGGDGAAWAAPFVRTAPAADPPFLLTSVYPRAGGVRFYPLPCVDLGRLGIDVDARRKDLNRMAFVSQGIFGRIVAGRSLSGYFPSVGGDPDRGLWMQGRDLWLTADEVALLPAGLRRTQEGQDRPLRALRRFRVWRPDRVPHVTVDRIGSAGTIYHIGQVRFAPDCGLWFGVHWRRPDAPLGAEGRAWRETFDHVLRMLGDAGLGGRRAAGCGAFDWEEGASVEWPAPAGTGPYTTLSRYHPRPTETPAAFAGPHADYRLQAVAGYLSTPTGPAQRRRRLWLAAEGSALHAAGEGPYGDMVDVQPQVGDFPHPVWRYGLAAAVALQEE